VRAFVILAVCWHDVRSSSLLFSRRNKSGDGRIDTAVIDWSYRLSVVVIVFKLLPDTLVRRYWLRHWRQQREGGVASSGRGRARDEGVGSGHDCHVWVESLRDAVPVCVGRRLGSTIGTTR
jgi:hypothetical protein